MYSWLKSDIEPVEEPEVTWTEFTQLFRELYKCVHVSEYDREEKPVFYSELVPSGPLVQVFIDHFGLKTNGVNQQEPDTEANGQTEEDTANQNGQPEEQPEPEEPNLPITLLTCYYIQTHKGIRSSRGQCHPQSPISTTIFSLYFLLNKQLIALSFWWKRQTNSLSQ